MNFASTTKISNTTEIDERLKGLREQIKKIKNNHKRKQINKGIRKIKSLSKENNIKKVFEVSKNITNKKVQSKITAIRDKDGIIQSYTSKILETLRDSFEKCFKKKMDTKVNGLENFKHENFKDEGKNFTEISFDEIKNSVLCLKKTKLQELTIFPQSF